MSNDVVVTKAALDGLRQNRDELRRAHRDAMAEADTLRRQRDELRRAHRDAMAEADTLRRQRDEALQVLRQLATLADGGVTIKESAQVAWDLAVVARGVLAQCESEDAE